MDDIPGAEDRFPRSGGEGEIFRNEFISPLGQTLLEHNSFAAVDGQRKGGIAGNFKCYIVGAVLLIERGGEGGVVNKIVRGNGTAELSCDIVKCQIGHTAVEGAIIFEFPRQFKLITGHIAMPRAVDIDHRNGQFYYSIAGRNDLKGVQLKRQGFKGSGSAGIKDFNFDAHSSLLSMISSGSCYNLQHKTTCGKRRMKKIHFFY